MHAHGCPLGCSRYVDELREFSAFLKEQTEIEELRGLNLLGHGRER